MNSTRKRKREQSQPTITILISAHGNILPDRLDPEEMRNVYSYNPMPVSTCIIDENMYNSDMITIKMLIDKYKTNKKHDTIMKNFCKNFGEYYHDYVGKKTKYNRKRFNYFVKKYLSSAELDTVERDSPESTSKQEERPFSESDVTKIKKLKKMYEDIEIESDDEDEYDDLIDYYNIEQALSNTRFKSKMDCNLKRYKRDKTFYCKPERDYKTYNGITIINTNNLDLIKAFTETYTFDITNRKFHNDVKKVINKKHKSCQNVEYLKINHKLIPTLDENAEVDRDTIKLSELIAFLKDIGYEKIYIYDMTCNAEEERNVESAESIATNVKSRGSHSRGGGTRRRRNRRRSYSVKIH